MAIIGIERLVYGVTNMSESLRYFDDFGLQRDEADASGTTFLLPEGSRVVLCEHGDPRIPESDLVDDGVREVVWGCDSAESLERLVANLRQDRTVEIDSSGTAHFLADGGIAMGLKVFARLPVVYAPDPVNAPFYTNRVNQTPKWRRHCRPKCIQHVVFGVKGHEAAAAFMINRLGFRLTDIMRDCGIFLRCDGNNGHHQLFLLEADTTIEGLDGNPRFHHANFGVESLDELMIGVNHLERCGWPKSSLGLARHRLSSGLFCYLPCPAGGQAEYGTDFDVIDDTWIPRIYELRFCFAVWVSQMPPFLMDEPAWDWCYHPDYLPNGKTQPLSKPYPEEML